MHSAVCAVAPWSPHLVRARVRVRVRARVRARVRVRVRVRARARVRVGVRVRARAAPRVAHAHLAVGVRLREDRREQRLVAHVVGPQAPHAVEDILHRVAEGGEGAI